MRLSFIDTNLVLRYLVDDPQANKIEKLLKSNKKLILPSIVIAEIVWTLSTFYKWKKEKIISTLLKLFRLKSVHYSKKLIINTFEIFQKHNIKYTDAHIAALMNQKKSQTIYSFDHHFDKITGIKRNEP